MRENDTRLVRRNQRNLNSLRPSKNHSRVRTKWMMLRLLKERGKAERPKVKVYKISRQSRRSRLDKLIVAKFGKLSYNEIHQDMNF